MSLELTMQDVAEHNTKKDCYIVIHDKIIDITKFVEEHPGGEEVMLDCAGQDATEEFEDIGHSDEAREQLEPLTVGTIKRLPGDPALKKSAPATQAPGSKSDNTGVGITLYAIMLIGGAAAYGAYSYLQSQQGGSS